MKLQALISQDNCRGSRPVPLQRFSFVPQILDPALLPGFVCRI